MKLVLWPDVQWRKSDYNGNRGVTPAERSVHGGTFYCIVISHCTVVNIMQLFPSAQRCWLKLWTSQKSVWQLKLATVKSGSSSLIDFWLFLALGSQSRSGGGNWVTGNGETHTSTCTELCDALTVPPGLLVNGDWSALGKIRKKKKLMRGVHFLVASLKRDNGAFLDQLCCFYCLTKIISEVYFLALCLQRCTTL